MPHNITDVLLSIVIWIGILGNLLIGSIVLNRNRKSKINIIFAVLAFASALWGIFLFFFEHPILFSISSYVWLKATYSVVLVMIGILFYLSYIFPLKSTKKTIVPTLLYIPTALFFTYTIIFTKLFATDTIRQSWGYQQILGPLYPFFAIWATTFSIWALINYLRNYKKAKGLARTQLRFLFLGMTFFIIIPVTLDVIFPILLNNSRFIWFSPISATFLVGFIGYSIIKHRFMDIRLIVARVATYSLLLLTLGIVYTGTIFAIGTYLLPQTFSTQYLGLSTIIVLFTAFTFQPLRRFFEKITNKIFYKNRYNEDKLLKTISHTMASTLTLSTLAYKILDVFINEMNISKAYFAILSNNKLYVIESNHKNKHLELSKPEFDLIKTKNEISVFEELEEGKIKDLFREKGFSLALPIKTDKYFIGFLILAEKSSGDIYFSDDINLLEIIGPELAIALQNAQRFEEIKQFNIVLQSEVEKATEDLKEANTHLKDLDKMKDEFISVASHELRTPMTAIKGFLWLALNKHKLPKKAKETLEEAYLSTERSIALVNDMLDVSRIESGRIDLNPKKADLVKLAIKVQDQLNSKITEKNLKFQIEKNEPQFTVFDQDKILQVFINLVGNAIKFTPKKGTISISFKNKNGYIETSITDTGIGIKKEDFSKLFHKFGRLDSSFSSVSESPGTGLGLYITKQIIELSGGKISATSELKKGTTFTFTLPKIQNTK